jgi:nucleotidyltransferase/DNA polymerase involved in DNA repair
MYAAMAFLAKIASDYRKTKRQFAITPDFAEPLLRGIPSSDSPLTRFTLDNIFYR